MKRIPDQVTCFVSYSHQDGDFVDFLERGLVHYRDGIELLRDHSGLARSDALDAALRDMVSRCDVFLPVVSAAYTRSTWCQREYAWFSELRPDARLLPLRLFNDATVFPNHLGVDFTVWATRGDRILCEVLVPTLRGNQATRLLATPDLEPSLALEMAQDFHTLGVAVSRIDLPTEADRAFSQIGIRLMQMPGMPTTGLAIVASVLAGQQVQRGQWAALYRWASEALVHFGEYNTDLAKLSDEKLTFLSGRLMELALAERRLGLDDDAGRHYAEALLGNSAIADPTLRCIHRAQVFRELGTLALARLKLSEARQMYEQSRELIDGIPSERMHIAQAWIKQAQVEIFMNRDVDAHRCIKQADEILHTSQSAAPSVPDTAAELQARVSAHYWKTRAWVDFTCGDRDALRRDVLEHARAISPYPWRNERNHQRALQALAAVSPAIPTVIARQLARALIAGESGLFARAMRSAHDLLGTVARYLTSPTEQMDAGSPAARHPIRKPDTPRSAGKA